MKTILACVDFSEVTSPVLETAAAMGAAFGAKVYLLNIVETRLVPADFTVPTTTPTYLYEVRAARTRLNELRESLSSHGLEAATDLVETHARPAEQILDEARSCEADLIILGSHGHGAVYRLVMGSTAEAVVRGASCPVLLVPSRRAGEASKREKKEVAATKA